MKNWLSRFKWIVLFSFLLVTVKVLSGNSAYAFGIAPHGMMCGGGISCYAPVPMSMYYQMSPFQGTPFLPYSYYSGVGQMPYYNAAMLNYGMYPSQFSPGFGGNLWFGGGFNSFLGR